MKTADPAEEPADNPNKQVYYYSDKAEVRPVEPVEPGKPAKKSRIGLISAALIILFVAAVALYLAGDHGENRHIESGREYFEAALDEASILEDTGIDIADFWYDALESGKYGGTREGALEAALALHQDDIDSMADSFENLDLLYEKARGAAERAGQNDLASAIDDVQNDLHGFYDAVLNYDCEYNDYADAYNETDEKLYDSMYKLYNMLLVD